MLIKVIELKPAGGHRLWLRFSDGREGEHDFAPLIATGRGVLAGLADEALFRQVFLERGIPTWPNGFDFSPWALHADMTAAGELRSSQTAAE